MPSLLEIWQNRINQMFVRAISVILSFIVFLSAYYFCGFEIKCAHFNFGFLFLNIFLKKGGGVFQFGIKKDAKMLVTYYQAGLAGW